MKEMGYVALVGLLAIIAPQVLAFDEPYFDQQYFFELENQVAFYTGTFADPYPRANRVNHIRPGVTAECENMGWCDTQLSNQNLDVGYFHFRVPTDPAEPNGESYVCLDIEGVFMANGTTRLSDKLAAYSCDSDNFECDFESFVPLSDGRSLDEEQRALTFDNDWQMFQVVGANDGSPFARMRLPAVRRGHTYLVQHAVSEHYNTSEVSFNFSFCDEEELPHWPLDTVAPDTCQVRVFAGESELDQLFRVEAMMPTDYLDVGVPPKCVTWNHIGDDEYPSFTEGFECEYCHSTATMPHLCADTPFINAFKSEKTESFVVSLWDSYFARRMGAAFTVPVVDLVNPCRDQADWKVERYLFCGSNHAKRDDLEEEEERSHIEMESGPFTVTEHMCLGVNDSCLEEQFRRGGYWGPCRYCPNGLNYFPGGCASIRLEVSTGQSPESKMFVLRTQYNTVARSGWMDASATYTFNYSVSPGQYFLDVFSDLSGSTDGFSIQAYYNDGLVLTSESGSSDLPQQSLLTFSIPYDMSSDSGFDSFSTPLPFRPNYSFSP